MSYFTDLGLAEPLLRALSVKGYADPTPIQRQAIPALMEGRDLLGIAQTGTGKTAAFSLPSLHRLANDPQPRRNASCRMLVLSPTRELAAQIAENMRGYARFLNLSVQCVFGGVPVGKQARMLVSGTDVLVATPGRLLDLIDQRALTLRNVEIFVLDEADQMMDLGFIHALKRISALLPQDRQSLFFSATMPTSIAELGKQFIKNPVRVEVTPQATTAERVEQYTTHLNQSEKQALLTLKLRAGLADQSIDRALVFTRTKHGADRVVRHLSSAGVNAAAIHGNKSQAQRTGALQAFRNGSTPVLVATDIAARGIDVSGVSHVFNFELPNVAEQYVHRIGRTARAGADGVAISFVAPDERAYLKDIERLTGVKLTPMPLPQDFTAEAARLPAPTRKPVEVEAPRGERGERGQHRRGRGLPARRDEAPRGEGYSEGRGERRFERGPRPMRDDARRPQRDPRERPQERGMEIDPRARPGQHRDAVRSADPRRQRDTLARDGARDGQSPRESQRREWQPRDGGDRQDQNRQGQNRQGQNRQDQNRQGKHGGARSGGKPAMGGDRRFGEMPRGAGRPQGQRGGGKPRG